MQISDFFSLDSFEKSYILEGVYFEQHEVYVFSFLNMLRKSIFCHGIS